MLVEEVEDLREVVIAVIFGALLSNLVLVKHGDRIDSL